MGWLTFRLTLELGRERPSEADEHAEEGSQLDAMVEAVGAPEKPQMGFIPPSDPMRRHDRGEEVVSDVQ